MKIQLICHGQVMQLIGLYEAWVNQGVGNVKVFIRLVKQRHYTLYKLEVHIIKYEQLHNVAGDDDSPFFTYIVIVVVTNDVEFK